MRKTRVIRLDLSSTVNIATKLPVRQKAARQKLVDVVKALAKQQHPRASTQQADFETALLPELLQRPTWLQHSEARKLTARVEKRTTVTTATGDKFTRVESAPWLRVPLWDDDTAAMMQTLNSETTWSKLDRKSRDAAQKRRKRFESVSSGAFRQGRPPLVPDELVQHYVALIEKATGGKFQFSRDANHGKPGGPQLRVLMAALDHACFATPCPSIENVIKIVKKIV